jgi:hypothetical protein
MSIHLFRPTQEPKRTYLTYESAVKSAERVSGNDYRYIVAATHDGKYFPVFVGDDFQALINIAHAGYAVAN